MSPDGSDPPQSASTGVPVGGDADVFVRDIADGATVAIGGSLNVGHPMALVRALLRRRPKDLLLVGGMTAGLELDMLVAAGVARGVVAPYVGAEDIASLPPAIRWAAEEGRLEMEKTDEGVHLAALRARAQRLPYATWTGGVGTAAAESDQVEASHDALSGMAYLKVRPRTVDVALLWAEAADVDGNLLLWGPDLGDEALRAAADRRVVQVDRLVDTDVLVRTPDRVAPWQADAVLVAPLGTHPFGGAQLREDVAWLNDYVLAATDARAAASPHGLERFLDEWARDVATEDAYFEKLGGRRLRKLFG